MNESASQNAGPGRGVGQGALGTALSRLFRPLLSALVAVALYLGAGSVAQAADGKPAGWDVSAATRSATIGKMRIQWEPALDDDAYDLIAAAPRWWSEIETALAGDVDDSVTITFLDHAGRVAEASAMPRWVAGVAHSSSGEILIARHGPDGTRTDLEELLKHEMAHVVLYRALDGHEVPRWFNEGVADSFTGTLSLTRAQTLATAVFGPGVPDLEELEKHFRGADGVDASVAYAASRDLVSFLRDRDGDIKIRQLITEVEQGHRFEVAIIRTYDLGLEELVTEWRSGLPGRFVWYPMIAGGGLPFALVVPFVALAWFRRRRVLAEGWRRLEEQDAAEAAARTAGIA